MKTCRYCKKTFELDFFYKDRSRPDGFCNDCKKCKNTANEKWRKNNLRNKAIAAAKWRKNNRDKVNAQQIRYRSTHKEKYKAARKRNRERHPEIISLGYRRRDLMKRFGLRLDDYDALLKSQNYSCKICLKPKNIQIKNFHVDHCHKSNKVRGLLCTNCNLGLGCFKDNLSTLKNAISYLEVHYES